MQRIFFIIVLSALPCHLLAEHPDRFGFGRTPSEAEVRQWDIDIMPDGTGLPQGRGTAPYGMQIYREKCLSCHGQDGVGGVNDQLVGKYDPDIVFAKDMTAVRTIGNYWPYATTLYDYIYRAMPHTAPGTLEANEVYSLVAYLLFLNDIIDKDQEMDKDTLPQVVMPAKQLFYWSDEVKQ